MPYWPCFGAYLCDYQFVLFSSIIWDKCRNPLPPYYHRRDCTSLLPSRPRILDPINPSSNLYNHGFKEATPIGFHDGLQGKWGWMVRNIRTLDLSKAAGY